MPRGIKKVEETPQPNDQIATLVSIVSNLAASVKALEARIDPPEDVLKKIEEEKEADPDEDFPIPPKWIKIKEEVLDSSFKSKEKFGIEVKYPEGGNAPTLTIIVPLDVSNASKDYLTDHKVDRRTIVLDPSQGENGVLDWCVRIKKNLNFKKN